METHDNDFEFLVFAPDLLPHRRQIITHSYFLIIISLLCITKVNAEEEYPLLEAYFNERTEEKAWAIASAANDIEAYQEYFQKYPNGKYKEETQRLIRRN